MSLITSRQHTIVKQCRAARRGDDVRLLLDGWHLVGDALASGVALHTIAVCRDVPAAHVATIEAARAAGAAVLDVADSVMEAISPVREPSGIVALAERPLVDPTSMLAPAPPLVVACVGVQDPGNVGALIRSADAGGATGVLLDETSADPWGWKALRASMGSIFRLPVVRDVQAVARLTAWRADGLHVAAADPRGGTSMYDADLARPLVVVLGGEGAGLPSAVLARADSRLRIPMRPRVESLNVAVAAALLVYEATRQRAKGGRQ
jgi:TrmH family RNA methyltransferase